MNRGTNGFSTYFICLGNRCRSPFAAALWKERTKGLPVEIASAGTLDAPGMESPWEIHEMASSRGLDLTSHRSRALTGTSLEDADLVLGFELGHVAAAVVDAAAPEDKTFRLGELVRLLREVPPPVADDPLRRARSMIGSAHALRSRRQGPFQDDDVADPFRRPMKAYETMAQRIESLLEELAGRLFGR